MGQRSPMMCETECDGLTNMGRRSLRRVMYGTGKNSIRGIDDINMFKILGHMQSQELQKTRIKQLETIVK